MFSMFDTTAAYIIFLITYGTITKTEMKYQDLFILGKLSHACGQRVFGGQLTWVSDNLVGCMFSCHSLSNNENQQKYQKIFESLLYNSTVSVDYLFVSLKGNSYDK